MDWERDEWRSARDYNTPVRRFAGGIEIVGDPTDAWDDERVAERNTDEKGDSDGG